MTITHRYISSTDPTAALDIINSKDTEKIVCTWDILYIFLQTQWCLAQDNYVPSLLVVRCRFSPRYLYLFVHACHCVISVRLVFLISGCRFQSSTLPTLLFIWSNPTLILLQTNNQITVVRLEQCSLAHYFIY